MSFEAPPPMPVHRNSYPAAPPPPMQQAPPPQPMTYEPHAYQPPSEPPYAQASYNGNSNAKKKASRASQACDNCRQLKAKCDETKPCKTCREKNVECVYRESLPKPYAILPPASST